MIASLPASAPAHPQVRRFNAWRDGRAVAGLLEHAFTEEMALSGSGSGSRQYLHMLRNFGPLEAASLRGMCGFVWEEDGDVVGHASVQRNPLKHDTWVLGNVATRADKRGHGIGRALVTRCIDEARRQDGCRCVALQMLEGNFAALRVYRPLGFKPQGVITRWRWANTWVGQEGAPATVARAAGLRDRKHIWACVEAAMLSRFALAEVIDMSAYHLTLGWKMINLLNGDRDAWFVSPHAAVRTQANIGGEAHALEMFALPDATPDEAGALVRRGLERLDGYITRPVVCSAPRDNPTVTRALESQGFQPLASFVHMTVEV